LVDNRAVYEKVRILIVEDEAFTRQMIKGLLHQLGFRLIDEAADGEAGFKEFLRVKPVIILCDIHMTPLDGLGFLAKLRGLSNPALRDTTVIFLTADKQTNTVMSAKSLRVDGYLVKPVSLANLKARLDQQLQRIGLL